MIDVPAAFATSTVKREGAAGEAWIAALPGVVEDLCALWGLEPTGSPWHGYLAVVVPVAREQVDLALKVSWIDPSSEQEPLALRTWNGHGAVQMLASRGDLGAMLLERLNADRSLHVLPHEDAAEVAGTLLRRLSVPAPPELRTVSDRMAEVGARLGAQWETLGRPFSRRLLDHVTELIQGRATSTHSLIVNQDLHYDNVLEGTREPWLVIDPKVLAGDPEFGVAPLLWTRFEEMEGSRALERRMDLIVEASESDADLARGWTIVRVAEYWLWALSEGFSEDPIKCRTLIDWLVPNFAS